MSSEPLLLNRIAQLKKDNEMLQQNYTLLGTLLANIIEAHNGEFRFKPNLKSQINLEDKRLQWFEDPETLEMVFKLV